jgi:hypothetical protein
VLIVDAEPEDVTGCRDQMPKVAIAVVTGAKSAGGTPMCGPSAVPAQAEAR